MIQYNYFDSLVFSFADLCRDCFENMQRQEKVMVGQDGDVRLEAINFLTRYAEYVHAVGIYQRYNIGRFSIEEKDILWFLSIEIDLVAADFYSQRFVAIAKQADELMNDAEVSDKAMRCIHRLLLILRALEKRTADELGKHLSRWTSNGTYENS